MENQYIPSGFILFPTFWHMCCVWMYKGGNFKQDTRQKQNNRAGLGGHVGQRTEVGGVKWGMKNN